MQDERTCAFEGCGSPVWARKWCNKHYLRWWKTGDPGQVKKRRRSRGVTPDGYVRIWVGDQRVFEHRHVVEQQLGRPLSAHEHVHHRNGQRADNRPENLELWVTTARQPKGQRVEDLLAFVVQHYPQQVAALLRKQRSDGSQPPEHPMLW